MTIGIAAFGPNAGEAILRGLATVEAVGRGAIGGFVSLAVISGGELLRAETQTGGSTALFAGALPAAYRRAQVAVLMSSGPNRPEPLSQFTPGDAHVGLLTGHRFPNAGARDGVPLNERVLSRMRTGEAPRDAISATIAENPDADAGLIAVSADGRLHAANTPYLSSFADAGLATFGDDGTPYRIAVLHNAIRPFRGLAVLAADAVRDWMERPDRSDGRVRVTAGTHIQIGPRGLHVDDAGCVQFISMPDPTLQAGTRSFGIGFEADVIRASARIGRAVYEPYMVARDGKLLSVEGGAGFDIPYRTA